MPLPRPLEHLGVAELQDLAFTHWTSQRTLTEIERELSLRAFPTAIDLCDEIRTQLATFPNAGFTERHSADGPPRTAPMGGARTTFWARARHRLFVSQARARATVGTLIRAMTHWLRDAIRATG